MTLVSCFENSLQKLEEFLLHQKTSEHLCHANQDRKLWVVNVFACEVLALSWKACEVLACHCFVCKRERERAGEQLCFAVKHAIVLKDRDSLLHRPWMSTCKFVMLVKRRTKKSHLLFEETGGNLLLHASISQVLLCSYFVVPCFLSCLSSTEQRLEER